MPPMSHPSSSAGLSTTFFERVVPVAFRYRGRTSFAATSRRALLRFAPNLSREHVSFDAEIAVPLAFREAMGTLHDVVVSDHRHHRRGRAAWLSYKERVARPEADLRAAGARATHEALADAESLPALAGASAVLSGGELAAAHRRYWRLRGDVEAQLRADDPALFRALAPCDPIVTVGELVSIIR
jgi:hypothetical protein